MQKRKLRIVKQTLPALGICERCTAQFKGDDVQARFNTHKCKLMDTSQNALRIVREAGKISEYAPLLSL